MIPKTVCLQMDGLDKDFNLVQNTTIAANKGTGK